MTMETEDATDKNNAPITPICKLFSSPIFVSRSLSLSTLNSSNKSNEREKEEYIYTDERERERERERRIVNVMSGEMQREIYERFLFFVSINHNGWCNTKPLVV